MKIIFNQSAKRERAFSLVEVMVAATIAAIILTALYTGIATNFAMLNTTRQNLRATQIIVSKIEAVRLCAWGNGTNQATQLFDNTIVPTSFTETFYPLGLYQNLTNQGVTYYGTIVVTNTTAAFQTVFGSNNIPTYVTNMAVVSVTVIWTNGYGIKNVHTRRMSTLAAQNGVQNYIYTH